MFFKKVFNISRKLIVLLVVCLATGCQTDSSSTDFQLTELDEFKTFISFEDDIVGVPNVIKYDNESNLFIFDAGKTQVLEVDSTGTIVNEFGRKGRGPGELLRVKNFFLVNNSLYIVDHNQYMIHRYNLDGNHLSSMNYGAIAGASSVPPVPFSSSTLRAEDLNFTPTVSLKGNILLSLINTEKQHDLIYKLVDWEGNHISDMGHIPEGSSTTLQADDYESAILNNEMPGVYKPNAFPVNDLSNPEEIFLIYSAIPKIAKYSVSGKKLWGQNIPRTAEVDSITNYFFEASVEAGAENRYKPRKYRAGASNQEGELFLMTDWKDLYIHQFNKKGELIQRFRLISDEVELIPIFDVDYTKKRFFVVTEEGEIRTYPF